MTRLAPAQLRRRCAESQFNFSTTRELTPLQQPLGQNRALDALQMAVRMTGQGYNVFASGPTGTGRRDLVSAELEREASARPVPDDWCYVHHFSQPDQPLALRMPAGRGGQLREALKKLVLDVQTALPAAFSREENRRRQEEIEHSFQERQHEALAALSTRAEAEGIVLLETESGFAFAPRAPNGEAMTPTDFQHLPSADQERVKSGILALQEDLQRTLRQFPIWFKETRDKLRALNHEIAQFVVAHLVGELLTSFNDLPHVHSYLEELAADIVDNAPAFMPVPAEGLAPGLLPEGFEREEFLRRYAVNLLVDHQGHKGAPVVLLDLPTIGNLIGRIEHRALMGTFRTDFTLVKAGALHRANGGFLVVDARQMLLQPFAWETLKRSLLAQEIRFDVSELQLGLLTTVSIEPAPIPLDIKVVLVGERWLLQVLESGDPEFHNLFKMIADFEDQLERTPEREIEYAALFAGLSQRAGCRPLTAQAVARLVEHCARLAEDANRLITQIDPIDEVIREGDYQASTRAGALIEAVDIDAALFLQRERVGRLRNLTQESIQRGIRLIDTDGEAIGQINGLAVVGTNGISFGTPTRITATTRLGEGRIVDIERETELGGATHTKGVLILSNFLASRYARNTPLALSASIVFEQSYGSIDGDSASLAELCALVSSLAGVPLSLAIAVTGSVNQLGEVQAIGGVNEKIEGFFDLCKSRGLAKGQGVIVPASNVEHLMLREEIVTACAEGDFEIHGVRHVDEALELLTGRPAGKPDGHGAFPQGTVNRAVAFRLARFARLRAGHSAGSGTAGGELP